MNAPTTPTEGQILTGPLFNEPMRVETVAQTSPGSWTLGLVGTRSERFRKVSLAAAELAGLTVLDSGFQYDGDGALLRLDYRRTRSGRVLPDFVWAPNAPGVFPGRTEAGRTPAGHLPGMDPPRPATVGQDPAA